MVKKIVLLLILFSLFFHLFSGVEVLSCQAEGPYSPGKVLNKRSPTAIKLSKEANEAINSAKNCLPLKMGQDVENYLKTRGLTIQLVCDSLEDCAQAWDPIFYFEFSFSAAAIPIDYEKRKGSCGCIQGIILHEVIHLATGVGNQGHKEIFACTRKCTASIINCINFPPIYGKECDCKDFAK